MSKIKISEEVSLCIASDLHCTSVGEGKDISFLFTNQYPNPKNHHPIESLKDIKTLNKIEKIDYLICPGDITDKIDTTGFNFGWRYLQDISNIFNCKEIIATIGNHDLDSRNVHKTQMEPLYSAKNINELYPFSGDKTKFWTDNFEIIEREDLVLLNINSSASHVKSEKIGVEGNISIKTFLDGITVEKIKEKTSLYKDNPKPKIVLLHHHPIQFSDYFAPNYNDSDFLNGGDKLLEILNENKFQLIVHGHKHVPKWTNLSGINILSSGSLAAIQNLFETNSKNSFHLIKLFTYIDSKNSYKVGEMFTWEFTKGIGWVRPTPFKSKLKFRIGFGLIPDPIQVCKELYNYLHKKKVDYISFNKLYQDLPHLRFIEDDIFIKIFDDMEIKYGFHIICDSKYDLMLIKKEDGLI